MNGNGPYVVFYVAAAVFVATSLIARRLTTRQMVKMLLAWVAIFAVAIAIAVALGVP